MAGTQPISPPKGPKTLPTQEVSRLVFMLFMEQQLPAPYKQAVTNTLSNKKIELSPCTFVPAKRHLVQMVMDIPDFLQVDSLPESARTMNIKTIPQYRGYLVDLKGHRDADSYMVHFLSSRNRKNLLAKKRKLEQLHSISYRIYFGEMDTMDYNKVFDRFRELLATRFQEKKKHNMNLVHWDRYREMVLPLILEKKASLFVIYDGELPITVTLNFHLGDMVFSFIQGYDIQYSKFNMGDISMYNHLQWCTANGISVFDLSMGVTDYKLKWCNHTYGFTYQLFHKKGSAPAWAMARSSEAKLRLKQYLRDRGVLGKLFEYDRFVFKIKEVVGSIRGKSR